MEVVSGYRGSSFIFSFMCELKEYELIRIEFESFCLNTFVFWSVSFVRAFKLATISSFYSSCSSASGMLIPYSTLFVFCRKRSSLSTAGCVSSPLLFSFNSYLIPSFMSFSFRISSRYSLRRFHSSFASVTSMASSSGFFHCLLARSNASFRMLVGSWLIGVVVFSQPADYCF